MMNQIISKFLNHISVITEWGIDDTKVFTFYGDGLGDRERYSDKVTKETLEKYIKHCNEQIELAKICLEKFE